MNSDFIKAVQTKYDEAEKLLLRKHKDYGPKNISASPGGAINGLRVRIHDKLARINNLYDSGVAPKMKVLGILLSIWLTTQLSHYSF